MKKGIVLFFVLITGMNTKAQSIEGYGNFVYSNSHIDFVKNDLLTFEGYLTNSFGINYNFNDDKKWSYVLGLSYERKGSDNHVTSSVVQKTVSYRFDYVNLKLLGRMKLGSNEIHFGTYIGGLTNASATPLDYESREELEYKRNYEVGLTLVANQRIFSSSDFSGYVRLEGNYGLTSIWGLSRPTFSFSSYYRNYTLGVGLALRWHYKKQK